MLDDVIQAFLDDAVDGDLVVRRNMPSMSSISLVSLIAELSATLWIIAVMVVVSPSGADAMGAG